MQILVLFLLIGFAFGAPSHLDAFSDNDLQSSLGGYLPPSPSENVVVDACLPSTVYQTSVQYSTRVVYTTIYDQKQQFETQSEYKTQVVPSTFYSQVVSTRIVPSAVYETQFVTQFVYNTQTSYVNLPAITRYVTITQTVDRASLQVRTQYSTSILQVPTTVYREAIATQFVPRPVLSKVFRTQYVTSTQQLPGQTRLSTQVQYSVVYSTQVAPASTLYLTSTLYSTQIQYSTVYQSPITQILTSTNYQQVYTTVFSEAIRYQTQTQVVTSIQTVQRYNTVYSTRAIPQYVTRVVNQPRDVYQTITSTQLVPTTFYSTAVEYKTVNAPAETSYVTATQILYQTQQLQGQTRIQYVTRTAYNTNYATSVVYNTIYNTVTATETQTANCQASKGYSYNQPATPFHY